MADTPDTCLSGCKAERQLRGGSRPLPYEGADIQPLGERNGHIAAPCTGTQSGGGDLDVLQEGRDRQRSAKAVTTDHRVNAEQASERSVHCRTGYLSRGRRYGGIEEQGRVG